MTEAPLFRSLDAWRRDVRHAMRALANRPGFVAAAAITLALGIGANTAIFSLVNGVVLRPLPYERADRLVVVWEDLQREGNHRFSVSLPNYRDWRDQSTVFSGAAGQVGTGKRMEPPHNEIIKQVSKMTDGTEIITVVNWKKVATTVPIPVRYMWWAHTIKLRKASTRTA